MRTTTSHGRRRAMVKAIVLLLLEAVDELTGWGSMSTKGPCGWYIVIVMLLYLKMGQILKSLYNVIQILDRSADLIWKTHS